jgi:hypothetical protein
MDPSYPRDVVRANWVPGASVVYVGKTECKNGLRGRVCGLVDFAHGKSVAHRGGRMLWHLSDWPYLEVSYRDCKAGTADGLESQLVASFRAVHGDRPFANMTK